MRLYSLVNMLSRTGASPTSVVVDAALTATVEPAMKMQQNARIIEREASMVASCLVQLCSRRARACPWQVQREAAPWLPLTLTGTRHSFPPLTNFCHPASQGPKYCLGHAPVHRGTHMNACCKLNWEVSMRRMLTSRSSNTGDRVTVTASMNKYIYSCLTPGCLS